MNYHQQLPQDSCGQRRGPCVDTHIAFCGLTKSVTLYLSQMLAKDKEAIDTDNYLSVLIAPEFSHVIHCEWVQLCTIHRFNVDAGA